MRTTLGHCLTLACAVVVGACRYLIDPPTDSDDPKKQYRSAGRLAGPPARTPAHSSWRTSAFLSQQDSAAVNCLWLWACGTHARSMACELSGKIFCSRRPVLLPPIRRYPFTSCEVFCCEVEAIFNTLLEDEDLLQLLFSLLDQAPPLSCKAAGYFGRVVGQLLLRKTNEMMQHLSHNDEILEKLIQHVDTTSIADIIKRLVGADDHSSMIFSPMHTQWLADTPLVTMLLDRLGPQYSTHVQVRALTQLASRACCGRLGRRWLLSHGRDDGSQLRERLCTGLA